MNRDVHLSNEMGYKTVKTGVAKNAAWGSFCERQSKAIYCGFTVNESSFGGGILDPMIAIENGPFIVDLPINHGDCS